MEPASVAALVAARESPVPTTGATRSAQPVNIVEPQSKTAEALKAKSEMSRQLFEGKVKAPPDEVMKRHRK